MLTKALLRVRVVKDELRPQYIDVSKADVQADAEQLLELARSASSDRWSRGELDQAIDDLCADRRDHKLVRGLAKIMVDRTEFAETSPVDPQAFREEVFVAARALGPLTRAAHPLGSTIAADVLAAVGARHGMGADEAADALYADLQDSHRVTGCRLTDAAELLHRYNLALAQSVLLNASALRLRLPSPEPARVRQLVRALRFHQLLASAERDGDELVLTLDGPASMFKQSKRYGMQLAQFLPTLLLQPGGWRLDATVLWTAANHEKRFTLSPADALVSTARDVGAYRTKEQRFFEERFAELGSEWSLIDGDELLPIGPKRLIFPDYTLVRGMQRVHLQWVGFWRPETLEPYLADIERYAPSGLLLAVSERLATGKDPASLPTRCVLFKEVLSPKKIVEAAARNSTT
jgi:predicted nuclease of restriction endonuclease-like RecB superfamily